MTTRPYDLRTSCGEVVRRVDLERAAGRPRRHVPGDPHATRVEDRYDRVLLARAPDPSVAGDEGVLLAQAALAGDLAALDQFHERAGLVLAEVAEYSELEVVRLVVHTDPLAEWEEDPGVGPTPVPPGERRRPALQVECAGRRVTVDAAQLVAWIQSPAGRAALARRGVDVPPVAEVADARPAASTTGRPRRARRREVFEVVGVDELLRSADPEADPDLPAWARRAVSEQSLVLRRTPSPGSGTVEVVARSPDGWIRGTYGQAEDLVVRDEAGRLRLYDPESFRRTYLVVESSRESAAPPGGPG